MENPKNQLVERVKSANNILVTVSTNPSVDQLAAAIGLTIMLNKMGKHATAVFSGAVPSTIEFLQPEKTIEKNTDSLRDFIIALDKSKADKLRYKVEDSHVKIFITPYRTSITDADLEFSQGDFNVEVILALGVKEQSDLDQVITTHGRILHDATTIAVTNDGPSTLGTINWAQPEASSLCEMVASLADQLQKDVLDNQIATALMTGIVAETERFRNDKTSPAAMSVSATLMAAGANQQLVTSKLEQGASNSSVPGSQTDAQASPDGSLDIDHNTNAEPDVDHELPEFSTTVDEPPLDAVANLPYEPLPSEPSQSAIQGGSSLILDPPSLGGKLTANSEPEHLDPSTDPLGITTHDQPILSHSSPQAISTPDTDSAPADTVPDANLAPVAEPVMPSMSSFVPAPSDDTPLPSPGMDLPSEQSQSGSPLPDEQPLAPVPEPIVAQMSDITPATQPEPAGEPVQTLSDLEAAVRAAAEPAPAVESLPPDAPAAPVIDEQPPMPDFSVTPVAPEPDPLADPDVATVDSARDAVSDALASIQNQPLPPIAALNAQPLDLEIKQTGQTGIIDSAAATTSDPGFTMPQSLVPDTGLPTDFTAGSSTDPTAPPAVPPPFMPDINGLTLPPQDQPPTPGGSPFNLPPA